MGTGARQTDLFVVRPPPPRTTKAQSRPIYPRPKKNPTDLFNPPHPKPYGHLLPPSPPSPAATPTLPHHPRSRRYPLPPSLTAPDPATTGHPLPPSASP
jgi:hypothetical protein